MIIIVKKVDGTSFTVEVDSPEESMALVACKIAYKENVHPVMLKLIYNGRILNTDQTFQSET